MTQHRQRSRRFRAARESREKEAIDEKLRRDWNDKGRKPPPKKAPSWDTNVITPGTPFMAKLAEALHYYIKVRVHADPGWRGVCLLSRCVVPLPPARLTLPLLLVPQIKVIFSDAKMPGEGEHKIMNFLRLQRAQPGYNPNLRHCLYGMVCSCSCVCDGCVLLVLIAMPGIDRTPI